MKSITEDSDESEQDRDAVEWPITNELDLHAFRPSEVSSLLPEYFLECMKRGIFGVRVVHGKGRGVLRAGVHQLLNQLDMVQDWQWPVAEGNGGWGATWVGLRQSSPTYDDTDSQVSKPNL